MKIVSHDGEIVHAAADFLQLEILVELGLGRQRRSQQQAWADGIELAANLSGHCREIPGVFGKARACTAFDRVLPVNINAIEDSRHMNARSEISLDKSADARTHEFAHVLGLSGAGETL